MENCLGIISMTNMEDQFGSLCKSRPVYMLPFGGRYRLIDFTISNMVNHGISSIGVYTGEKIRSTMDHLGNGKPWDLNRRFGGLFLFPPLQSKYNYAKLGNIADYHSTESFFHLSKEENIFISRPNVLAKVNLNEACEHFTSEDYDVMFIYTRVNDEKKAYIDSDKLNLDEDGSFINIGKNLGTENEFNLYLGMMFIKKNVFLKLVNSAVELNIGHTLKDVVNVKKDDLKVGTYKFEGLFEQVVDTLSYYNANLDLLKPEVFEELFSVNGSILTKTKDEPSTFYADGSKVANSLIANGCIIEGEVENSIIFRGVKVGKHAVVKNSVIMQKTEIMDGAVVVNAILDKYSTVGKNASLAGSYNLPYIVAKKKELLGEDD